MTNKRVHELDAQGVLNANDVLVLDNTALGEAVKIAVTDFMTALSVTESQVSDLDHTDADAIHDNVAGEISAVTAKGSPVDGDYLLIEDSESGNVKKSVTIGDLPGGTSITVDTKANLLVTTPAAAAIGYATDVERFYVFDGSAWYESAVVFGARSAVDMGVEQNSSTAGYGQDYITNKTLHSVALKGHPADPVNGSVRTDITQDPDTFEIYLREAWQTIIYDLTTDDGDFRHAPIGESIYVWRGDSVLLGLNGRSMVSEYSVSMGAYPPPRVVNGGTF